MVYADTMLFLVNEEEYSLKRIDQKAKAKKELEVKAQKGIEQAESFINTSKFPPQNPPLPSPPISTVSGI